LFDDILMIRGFLYSWCICFSNLFDRTARPLLVKKLCLGLIFCKCALCRKLSQLHGFFLWWFLQCCVRVITPLMWSIYFLLVLIWCNICYVCMCRLMFLSTW